jgi:hypothetical protein
MRLTTSAFFYLSLPESRRMNPFMGWAVTT